jgi:hypothetical protein
MITPMTGTIPSELGLLRRAIEMHVCGFALRVRTDSSHYRRAQLRPSLS